jgi:hypothetical protein
VPFVLLVLNKVNEMISDTKSNIIPSDLDSIYEYINAVISLKVPTFDKVTFTSKNAERNGRTAKEMLYLSKVLGSVDKIRMSCAEKNYNDLNPFEQCREKNFATVLKASMGFDNSNKIENAADNSISMLDDLKAANRQELTERNIIQPRLSKKIEILSTALVSVRNEDSCLDKDTQKDFDSALGFIRQHYLAEHSASEAVCEIIDHQRTMG